MDTNLPTVPCGGSTFGLAWRTILLLLKKPMAVRAGTPSDVRVHGLRVPERAKIFLDAAEVLWHLPSVLSTVIEIKYR